MYLCTLKRKKKNQSLIKSSSGSKECQRKKIKFFLHFTCFHANYLLFYIWEAYSTSNKQQNVNIHDILVKTLVHENDTYYYFRYDFIPYCPTLYLGIFQNGPMFMTRGIIKMNYYATTLSCKYFHITANEHMGRFGASCTYFHNHTSCRQNIMQEWGVSMINGFEIKNDSEKLCH